MAHSIILRRVIVGIAAIAFLFISLDLSAQTVYKRGAIMEEFTGTWCPHCPPGAWALDSMQVKYGDNLVEIAWHGGQSLPGPGQDDLWLKNHDTLFSFFGCTGWPTGIFNRSVISGFGFNGLDIPVYIADANNPVLFQNLFKSTPSIDYRIVNAAYNNSTRTISFDEDITPYDMSKMRSDDTTTYATIALLTEDNILEIQANAGDWDKVPAGDLEDFHEMNVVRKVAGGSLLGDRFTLGTKNASQTLPIRIHYTMNVDGSWDETNIRLKTFAQAAFPKTGKTLTIDVMDAKQTQYITGLPQTPPDAAWVVLPNANTTITPSAPTNIVWATGGTVGNNVKLEYSIDNGTTWNQIVASTNQSPYPWTIPQSAYGGTAMVRASSGNVSGNSQVFKTPGLITISKPAAGEVINGGTADYSITYKGGNIKSLLKFEYSTDNGSTRTLIGNLGNTDATTFDWSLVPNPTSDATQSMVRITDANGVVGTSGLFTIKAVANLGTINSVSVTGLSGGTMPNIASNKATTVTWTTNGGNLGSKLIAEYTVDNTITWQTISNSIDPTTTSVNWTTPAGNYANGCFVRIKSADADKSNITSQSAEFSIGNTAGISGLKIADIDANNNIGNNLNTTITWTSVGDVGTGLHVQYSSDNNNWTTIPNGNVGSAITSTTWMTPATYVATAYIRVISADNSNLMDQIGPFTIGAASGVASTSMNGYSISNYPNPFASETTINFTLPVRSSVTIRILDDLGREIDHLVSETLDAGVHSVNYNASKLANGIYTCTLESGATKLVGKLTVVK